MMSVFKVGRHLSAKSLILDVLAARLGLIRLDKIRYAACEAWRQPQMRW